MPFLRRWTPFGTLALLAAAGCGAGEAPSPEATAARAEPIVGGIVDEGHGYTVGVGDHWESYCTGTLVSRRTVLTAGHCFKGTTRVYFGFDVDNAPDAVIHVEDRILHPLYDDDSLTSDLAVLKLAEDAPVQPALLLRETMDDSDAWVGPAWTYVGYGRDDDDHYGIRRAVTFPIEAVGPANVGGWAGHIDETMVYYHTPHKNTCRGDSGGPSFTVRGALEHVSSTTSYGDSPCKVYGVNARADLPTVLDFIQPAIDTFEGTDPCRADGVCDESCNTVNALVDPDCAPNHCGEDGICVTACVMPLDPDCAGAEHCGRDGICDPTCPTFDKDCAPLCAADGLCLATCAHDADCEAPCAVEGEPCDDHDACTPTSICEGGVCVGESPIACPAASDECHGGRCSEASGLCGEHPLPDGTTCSVGTCIAGVCTAPKPSDGSGGGHEDGGGGAGGRGGRGGEGGEAGKRDEGAGKAGRKTHESDEGCGCKTVGRAPSSAGLCAFALAVLAGCARRRPRWPRAQRETATVSG